MQDNKNNTDRCMFVAFIHPFSIEITTYILSSNHYNLQGHFTPLNRIAVPIPNYLASKAIDNFGGDTTTKRDITQITTKTKA